MNTRFLVDVFMHAITLTSGEQANNVPAEWFEWWARHSLESETSLVFPQAVNIVVGGEFGAYFQELSPKEHCKARNSDNTALKSFQFRYF